MVGLTLFHCLLLCLYFKKGSSLNISIALTAPSNMPTLSPSLVSLSIEQDRWIDWVGATSRNECFFNTMENLKRLSGQPPRIRIGGNSQDRTIYDSNVQFSEATFPLPSAKIPYPEATNISVGDAFFATAQFLPSKTRVIWGLNFGQRNVTATIREARALLRAFSLPNITDAGIVLEAIEIGNEADLYVNNHMRAQGYDEIAYVKEWIAFASSISTALNLSAKSLPRFWGASFAGSSGSMTGFSAQAIIDQGILNVYPGSLITTISQHKYLGSFCSGNAGLLQDLMSKNSIRGNLTILAGDINAARSKGLEYVLGETNSYACHGAPGVSNTAGAALWMLDYLFFASQIGISRVYLHQGIGFKYNLLQPSILLRSPIDGTPLATPMPPHIQPSYYAAVIAAEVLGQAKADGTAVGAVELTIDHPRVAGYAFYSVMEGSISRVSRLLLINSQAYRRQENATRGTSRGKVHIDLWFSLNTTGNSPVVFVPPQSMTIKRLTIPYTDDTSGIAWAGQTYETSNGRVSGELKVERIVVERGVDLWDTEAILICFD